MFDEILYEEKKDMMHAFFNCNNEKNPNKKEWIKISTIVHKNKMLALSIRYYSQSKCLDIGTMSFLLDRYTFNKLETYELMLSNKIKDKFIQITEAGIILTKYNKELILKNYGTTKRNIKLIKKHDRLLEIFHNFLFELLGDNND